MFDLSKVIKKLRLLRVLICASFQPMSTLALTPVDEEGGHGAEEGADVLRDGEEQEAETVDLALSELEERDGWIQVTA